MESVVKSARTTEEAVRLALIDLNCSIDDVEINVLEEPSKGFLGILGARDAKVEVRKKKNAESGSDLRVVEARRTIQVALNNASDESFEYISGENEELVTFLKDVTRLMGVSADVKCTETDETVEFFLSGNNMGTIIGRRGDTLDALQYLTNIIANKRNYSHNKRIVLDSEGYRQRREETLRRLARRLAARVKRTGHKITLEPMSPAERRIIHTTLQDDPEVKTLSEGQEPYRRLVISPEKPHREERFSENKDYSYHKKHKSAHHASSTQRRYSQRPPKRSYTHFEDVDGKRESDVSENGSSLW